ncbi:UNVERIFIED_CONTAM: hypothetical protein Sradi_0876000 [Sesamum radiatum]|uniref:Aminotransferase-like plant mobile domain-containing protein n=1 Tax=Sesamum radiatum TaxID=300843 RepID=A0AAW2V2K3_SESRA
MDFEDHAEPFLGIVIQSGKDKFKLKGTTLCVHEPANEWTKDVLGYHANILHATKIHTAVHASLFTYVYNKHVVQAFLKLWCPSTNTLHAAIGEISISLWDIRGLYGLPIRAEFYDEVVPFSKDLLGDETCNSSIPRSCKYLLLAYHHLPKDSDGVLIFYWVGFWFKGPLLCAIPADIRDETYVAAFLSCWLCSVVLPFSKAGKIRASSFKVASRMAHEKNTKVVLRLNHLPNLEKGSKDDQATPAVAIEVAKPTATTSKRKHNIFIDNLVTALSGKNDVIFALPISNGQLSNPQPLEKLAGLEEGVLITPEGSIGSVNGICEFDLPQADAVLNANLQLVSKNDHPSIETPSKCLKVVLLAIMEKYPLVEDIWRSRRRPLRVHFGHHFFYRSE